MRDEGQAGNNKCTNINYCENGKPKPPTPPKPPVTNEEASGVTLNFLLTPADECVWGVYCLSLRSSGIVVGDSRTIWTAQHAVCAPGNCNVKIYGLLITDAWGNQTWLDQTQYTFEVSADGDVGIITSDVDLANVVPAIVDPNYKPQKGDELTAVYRKDIWSLTVASSNVTYIGSQTYNAQKNFAGVYGQLTGTFPWDFPSYGWTTNPEGALVGGASGGGMFRNGYLVGTITDNWVNNNTAVYFPYQPFNPYVP